MVNRLVNETSPYLLQHADNPVDWFPWGEEALHRAEVEDKPILLSIGYAACHWCHVMAHESFEDPETAALMNEHFVNIKVDREERPDLDGIYMNAVVAMTGQGGWPMTVVLTPEGEPFFGGTYFPPVPRYNMPSFRQVLLSVAQAWAERRRELTTSASEIAEHLGKTVTLTGEADGLDDALLQQAAETLARRFDSQEGGFGQAPKFPPSMVLEFLLRRYIVAGDAHALHMCSFTLDMMARGGIYDHLGGGFARYSTDARWLVPHFEKMLYDNALLARLYLHAWRVTGSRDYRRTVEETLDWVQREMTDEAGGFYSSIDADSEDEEGKFYVWSVEEIDALLDEDARLFKRYYGVSESGNWEGKNILHVNVSLTDLAEEWDENEAELRARLDGARQKLYQARTDRVWPGIDDKVLTAWNGLMLAAFAEAGRDLQRPDYLQTAVQNAEFLHREMRRPNGRLWRTWKQGASGRINAFLEDYAYLTEGLLALYQATFDERWYLWADELVAQMLDHFSDEQAGGFYDTSDDHETLIQRPKDPQDNATPSGNAMAATTLLKLSLYSGRGEYWDKAVQAIGGLREAMVQHPTAFGQWLTAAAFIDADPREVAIVGSPESAEVRSLLDILFEAYRPAMVVAVGSKGQIPLLQGRAQIDDRATAYVCRGFVCDRPVNDPDALASQLAKTSEV
ncbi:MAG: thioredoxin domain-containing protein [Candidatus Promineifilaceae bacterium]|nr:thioredoxin domain-containing protein [Candidatus Promineifilaceae bacterium]